MVAKIILTFISIIMLPSCGFKLQGLHQIPEHIKEIVILSENNQSTFIQQLKSCFKSNEIKLSRSLDQVAFNNHKDLENSNVNFSILQVADPEITEQVQGYNSKGQISYGRISAKIKYTLFDKKYKVIKENIIIRSRIHAIDPNQLLSNENQKNIILDELNIELINELIIQIAS